MSNFEPVMTSIWIIGQFELVRWSNVWWAGEHLPDSYDLVDLTDHCFYYLGQVKA